MYILTTIAWKKIVVYSKCYYRALHDLCKHCCRAADIWRGNGVVVLHVADMERCVPENRIYLSQTASDICRRHAQGKSFTYGSVARRKKCARLLWHKHHHLAAQPAHVFPPYPFKCHSKRERMQYAIPWKYVPLLGPCSESDCLPVVC